MTRALGTTGLQLTELGFGGGAIGGLYAAVEREAAIVAMQAAWDAGMRYFDTAPFYGFGLSERRVLVIIVSPEGDVLGKGLVRYTAAEGRAIAGLRSGEIETILGYQGRAALGREVRVEAVSFRPWSLELEIQGLQVAGATPGSMPFAKQWPGGWSC